VPRSIWILGFVSMLADISSEMIHSLLPVFMVTALGASALAVGVVEGVAEATALITKVFSGTLSDYLGRRKALAVSGYALAAFTKPFFAIATSPAMVLGARFVDRIGKGVRGAPRDALLADLAPAELRGAAFGLRQALDTVGAFAGPIVAIALMLAWANDFRAVFWVAVVPGVLAAALLLVGVTEPARAAAAPRANPFRREALARLGAQYWWVVALGATFALARFSEAFLVLRAQQLGLDLAWIPAVLVAMNVVYAAAAYPLGMLSDHASHRKLLAAGLLLLLAADCVLAYGSHLALVFGGVILWGLHMAATQGLLARMVADVAPADLRGTAFGFFNLASGVAMLAASVVAGFLWDVVGASVTFLAGGVFSVLSLALLPFMPRAGARPQAA
jgi:MFS family permease